MEPGPTPTLTASAPAAMRSLALPAVRAVHFDPRGWVLVLCQGALFIFDEKANVLSTLVVKDLDHAWGVVSSSGFVFVAAGYRGVLRYRVA